MNKNSPLTVAGIIFTIVAIVHLLRLLFNWGMIINGYVIPMWFSVLGLIIATLLAIWMFVARKTI